MPGACALLLLALSLLAACSSPNRGIWEGTFDGSISGTVEFRINARGTELEGTLSGTTRDGRAFDAVMEGKIRGDHFYAEFEGKSSARGLPVTFDGFLRGELAGGRATGDWSCELRVSGQKFAGDWQADQRGERTVE